MVNTKKTATKAKKNTSSQIRNIFKATLLKKNKILDNSNKLLSEVSEKNDLKKIVDKTVGVGKFSLNKVLLLVHTIAQLQLRFDSILSNSVTKKLLEQYNTKGSDSITLLNRIITNISFMVYSDRQPVGSKLNDYILNTYSDINKLVNGLTSKKLTFNYDKYTVSTLISWVVLLHKQQYNLQQPMDISKTFAYLYNLYTEKAGNLPQVYINYMFLLYDILQCEMGNDANCKSNTVSFAQDFDFKKFKEDYKKFNQVANKEEQESE